MSTEIFSAYAPGRVELLGNHTDYNEGVVLGAAIDRGLTVRGTRRNDQRIAIHSATMGAIEVDARELDRHCIAEPDPASGYAEACPSGGTSFRSSKLVRRTDSPASHQEAAKNRWTNYVIGVASELRALGLTIPGFKIEITGDLPARAGLSSSAALELATALFLLKLSRQILPRLEIAKICQRAEHRFVGIKSGLLDQVTSLFGKKDHAVFFDCRSEEVRMVPFPAGLTIIIADSGKRRDLSGGPYNLRRDQTHAAARALGVPALRDISLPQLESRSDVSGLLRRRARHIVTENERVVRGLELLLAGKGEGFGRLMKESHQSSRDDFENSTPELDRLVEIAQTLPGVLGARLTGAGFGGAAIVLCKHERAEEIAGKISSRYEKETGIRSGTTISRIADGAR
jgi:galactokinase